MIVWIGVGMGLIELGIGLIELGIGLIEFGKGLIELRIGRMELGIGLRINNARRTVLARVSGLVFYKNVISFCEGFMFFFSGSNKTFNVLRAFLI